MRRIRSILVASAASAVALAAAGPASADARPLRDAGQAGAGKNIVETAIAAGQFKTIRPLTTAEPPQPA